METIETYNIKAGTFEGPFNLLLSLIEERKLFINEISLATVTDEYMRYVNMIAELHPAHLASFISVASTLILIKSKSLLPGIKLTDDEEGDIKRLEERLRLYELFSGISIDIKKQFGKQIISAAEERHHNNEIIFLPDTKITLQNLHQLAQGLIQNTPKKSSLPEVEVKKVVSIEEMIDRLTSRIQTALKMNFKEFAGGAGTKEDKVTLIVGFLAMLELTRQGLLNVVQESNFEDIVIEKR